MGRRCHVGDGGCSAVLKKYRKLKLVGWRIYRGPFGVYVVEGKRIHKDYELWSAQLWALTGGPYRYDGQDWQPDLRGHFSAFTDRGTCRLYGQPSEFDFGWPTVKREVINAETSMFHTEMA